MCFSAQASFTAAAVLGTVGAITVTRVKKKEEIPLAVMPLFFAVQQLSEGLIWLDHAPSTKTTVLSYIFLFFAYLIWPFWIPLAYYLVEKSKEYRKRLAILSGMGGLLSIVLAYMIIKYPPTPLVENNHIRYDMIQSAAGDSAFMTFFLSAIYVASICGVVFFTSHKYLKIFAIVGTLSLAIALIFYLNSWQSVWCFFASVLSLIICAHFLDRK